MEADARPNDEAKPTRRQSWKWGVPVVIFALVMGTMVGRITDNPWWVVPVVIWAALGYVVGRWAKRNGYLPAAESSK